MDTVGDVETHSRKGIAGNVVPERYQVAGVALDEVLQTGPLPVRATLSLARSCLRTLSMLHAAGALHGAIRPAHVIVPAPAAFDQAILVDGRDTLVRGDDAAGRPLLDRVQYLCPERAGLLERLPGPACDLYSLGLVLHECLTGRPALPGPGVGDILRQQIASVIPDVRRLGVTAPRALVEVLHRLLRKDPDDRYQSAAAVLTDLEAIEDALEQGVDDPDIAIGRRDVRSTLTEPGLVGMQDELTRLDRELAAAGEGHGRLALIEADSGGGKTRILEELVTRAMLRRACILRGQGLSHAPARPLEILSGVARDLIAAIRARPPLGERVRARLGDRRNDVLSALPELAAVLGPAGEAAPGPDALGEERTLSALSALLDALGTREAPAIVALDDAQWADGLALKLIARWARSPPDGGRHVALIAAFRTDEAPLGHALRAAAAVEVTLPKLREHDLRALAESMAGPLPELAVGVVVRLSDGNPFFADAVLHGMVEVGALWPAGGARAVDERALAEIRSSGRAVALLARRLDGLPGELLDLLSTAAVLGKSFDLDLLAGASGLDHERVRAELEVARRRHLVWPDPTGGPRYALVHDRLREMLLERLAPARLRQLHRAAAERLEAHGDELAFEVAFHFDAAGEHERALHYALVAAGRARSRHALDTAERQYRIAARGVRAAGSAEQEQLYDGLGEVLLLQGKYDEAEKAFEAALALASDVVARARGESKLAELAFRRGQIDAAVDPTSRALRSLGEAVPRTLVSFAFGLVREVLVQAVHILCPRLFVGRCPLPIPDVELLVLRLHTRLAYCFYFRGSIQALWAHLRAMNLAERFPPTPDLAQAYANHGSAMTTFPWISRALRYSNRSRAICRSLGELWGEGQALHNHGAILYVASRYREAIEVSREARVLLERVGDRWEYNDALVVEALALLRLGELRSAAQLARRTLRIASEIGDAHSAGFALEVWARATGGDVPEDLLRAELLRGGGDVMTSAVVSEAEALRLLARARIGDAVGVLSRAWGRVREARLRLEYVAHLPIALAAALRREAEAEPPWAPARREAKLTQAERALRRGLARARRFQTNLPWALHEAALLDAIRGRPGRARRRLDACVAVAERQEARHERARALLSRARVGRSLGWVSWERDLAEARQELWAIGAEFEIGDEDRPVALALVDRFTRLLDIGRRIVSSLSKDEIFAQVEEGGRLLLRAESCTIRDVSPATPLGSSPPLAELLRRATAAGRPVIVPAPLLDWGGEAFARCRSALWAPIITRGRLSACLLASHTQVSELFTADDERVALFIATLASAALENAEGFDRARREVRARDDFLRVASHELKTPLTPLRLQIQLLLKRLRGGASLEKMPQAVQQLEIAQRSTERLAALVDQLLDVSRVAAGGVELARERVDLADLTRQVVERYRGLLAAARCEVDLALQGDVVGSWDRSRLDQVLANLLSNAVTFGPDKPIRVEVARAPGRAVLTVADHGIGIAREDQERIFQRYERAVSAHHFGGLGLGLYVVRQVVEAHGGTITVASTPGHGATFAVELPLDEEPSRVEHRARGPMA